MHSQFLGLFFPLSDASPREMVGTATYLEVVRRYWMFLPAAFLAERAAFRVAEPAEPEPVPEATDDAARRRRKANGRRLGAGMMAPYRNVVRMYLLIFFFAFASLVSLDHFAIYVVVYAMYFFPWRLVRRGGLPNDRALEA
ncbi:MAG TPA: hypothetical protein VF178_11150, partial [Gemmatimonadaceae bacterium]